MINFVNNNPVLDEWIKEKIGATALPLLSRDCLSEYQLMKLNETLEFAVTKSIFYRKKFQSISSIKLGSIDDFQNIPYTTPSELTNEGRDMICVPGSEISRIVTLNTSGSTGPPKRVFFTESDQELTVDFFHHGMQNLVDPTDTVIILLPCKTPGSVGDLLAKGLYRLGCSVVPYGFPDVNTHGAVDKLVEILDVEGITSMVGSPAEVLRLAEFSRTKPGFAEAGLSGIASILLSTDYISDALRRRLAEIWGCRVFEHYGMTEMGLGGAVSCETLIGYHPRENDLFFEIIDPDSGMPTVEGEYGEIVFTTLTRSGMPLIRYRTGDRSRWIPGPCPCGSVLRRMDKVLPRGVEKGRGAIL